MSVLSPMMKSVTTSLIGISKKAQHISLCTAKIKCVPLVPSRCLFRHYSVLSINRDYMGSSHSKKSIFTPICSRYSKDTEVISDISSMEEIEVCDSQDVPKDGLKTFEVSGGKVLLAKHKGALYAIGDKCTHYGAPLEKGALCNGRVRCPWHGACFSLETGDIEDFPGLDSIPRYDVTERGGKVMIKASPSLLGNNKRIKTATRRDPDNSTRFVIVGGGGAGAKCVETLRQEGFTGEIILITKEDDLPYDRPKLTKAMHLPSSEIYLRSEAFYNDTDITVQLNSEVSSLDAIEKSLKLANGQSIKYDKLFLATGGSPRTLNCPGHDLKGIYVIRKPEDSNTVAQAAKNKKVVVVGASFIGAEVAAYLSIEDRCSVVTVINNNSVPFEMSLGPEVGGRIQRLFEENGVVFKNKVTLEEVVGDGESVTGVVLSNGETVEADVVVLGIGVTPATKFLENTDIDKNNFGYVNVNKFLQTNIEDVYCGGDIASFPLFIEDDLHVSIGHWQIAHHHGHVAALNMVGKARAIQTVPFFWTVLYGKSIRYTGHGKYDDIVISGDLEALSFIAYYCKGDKVIAIASLMKDPAAAMYAEMLQQGQFLTKSQVLEDGNAIFKINLSQY